MSARVVRQPNRGSVVVYDDGTTVSVTSPRILAAKLALIGPAGDRPAHIPADEWQATVMQPLRDEIVDAIQARIDELLDVTG